MRIPHRRLSFSLASDAVAATDKFTAHVHISACATLTLLFADLQRLHSRVRRFLLTHVRADLEKKKWDLMPDLKSLPALCCTTASMYLYFLPLPRSSQHTRSALQTRPNHSSRPFLLRRPGILCPRCCLALARREEQRSNGSVHLPEFVSPFSFSLHPRSLPPLHSPARRAACCAAQYPSLRHSGYCGRWLLARQDGWESNVSPM